MAKNTTFPPLYNEALQVRISKLKEWGYLKELEIKSVTLSWIRNGNKTGSICIYINTLQEPYYLELDYNFRDEPRKYKIQLVTIPSNLGKGKIWYFICPKTGKRCRVLYSIGGYFYHREAFRGCMYEVQTYSKKGRKLNRAIGLMYNDEHEQKLYSRYFKRHYAGKPTKRYLKIIEQRRKCELFDFRQIDTMLK
mgnify:CR=1 FL=1